VDGEPHDLLRRAAQGDAAAQGELLSLHAARLERMVRLRMDARLRSRFDAADVLQETRVDAIRRLPEYLAAPPMPFFFWMRFLARQKLLELARRHLDARGRDARKELRIDAASPGADSVAMAEQLVARQTSPTLAARRAELRDRVQAALEAMEPADREILALRHFEQLTNGEAARELGIESAAASKRYARALERLEGILGPP